MISRYLKPVISDLNGSGYIIMTITDTLLSLLAMSLGCSKKRFEFNVFWAIREMMTFLHLNSVDYSSWLEVSTSFTKNKAEEQSFRKVLLIGLRQECFLHGQLYIALT